MVERGRRACDTRGMGLRDTRVMGRQPVRRGTLLHATALVGVLGLAGCRYLPLPRMPVAPPPPPVPEGPRVDAPWSLATRTLQEPIVAARSVDTGAGWRARVRLVELAGADALPVGERPAWIFAPGGGEPLEPAARFTGSASSGWLEEPFDDAFDDAPEDAEAGRRGLVAIRASAELPFGAGAALSIEPAVLGTATLELIVWHTDDGEPAAAVAMKGSVDALAIDEEHAAALGALDPSLWSARSGVEYAPLAAANGRDVLWCRVPTSGPGALVLEVAVAPAPTRGPEGLAHARELAALRAQARAAATVARAPTLLEEALARPEQRRALVVELARLAGRDLLLDLALVADALRLEAWLAALPPAETANVRTLDEEAWLLERAALVDAGREFDAERLDPALHAALYVHLGAVGAEPALLGDLVARASGAAEFERLVALEHESLLEDPRTGVRVRALRWLAERGAAPADFDPLGDRDARRAALDAWRAARATEGGAS